MTQLISPQKFTDTVGLLRSFFLDKGFLEVHTQNRLSILAACEDPFNVATYNYAGQVWPLPQTGQMWLEHELLSAPDSKGFFCVSTSYRQEPNAIPGRQFTSPFWNMSRYEDGIHSKKIDVILGGMETIGSAERSTDVDQMRDTFHTITEGAYANLLFDLFGKERVEAELEEFLKFDFFPRVGGGIGITRMIPALETI